MISTLLLLLAAAEGPVPQRPGISELRAEWTERMEQVQGFRAAASIRVEPFDGSASYTANATLEVWLQEQADHPGPVIKWTEVRPDGPTSNLTTVTLVTLEEATYAYMEERTAYVYSLEEEMNIPFQYYLLSGPTREFGAIFRIDVLGVPHPQVEGEDRPPETVASGANTRDMDVTGVTDEAGYRDLAREDAWILTFDPRDRDLGEEIQSFNAWLSPETLLPYRIQVRTPIEFVEIDLQNYAWVDQYDPATFELNFEEQGFEVVHRD